MDSSTRLKLVRGDFRVSPSEFAAVELLELIRSEVIPRCRINLKYLSGFKSLRERYEHESFELDSEILFGEGLDIRTRLLEISLIRKEPDKVSFDNPDVNHSFDFLFLTQKGEFARLKEDFTCHKVGGEREEPARSIMRFHLCSVSKLSDEELLELLGEKPELFCYLVASLRLASNGAVQATEKRLTKLRRVERDMGSIQERLTG